MAKTAFTIWPNDLVKLHIAVLGKVKNNIRFESMVLHNTPLCDLTELVLQGTLERAAEKLSCVVHAETVQKTVWMDRRHKKPEK